MPLETYPLVELQSLAVVIESGKNITDAFTLPQGTYPAAIVTPSSWTAADLTFQGKAGIVYRNLFDDDGNEITVTAAASRMIILPPDLFRTVNIMKIRSGTSGTPVNQAADRTLTLILRPTP